MKPSTVMFSKRWVSTTTFRGNGNIDRAANAVGARAAGAATVMLATRAGTSLLALTTRCGAWMFSSPPGDCKLLGRPAAVERRRNSKLRSSMSDCKLRWSVSAIANCSVTRTRSSQSYSDRASESKVLRYSARASGAALLSGTGNGSLTSPLPEASAVASTRSAIRCSLVLSEVGSCMLSLWS